MLSYRRPPGRARRYADPTLAGQSQDWLAGAAGESAKPRKILLTIVSRFGGLLKEAKMRLYFGPAKVNVSDIAAENPYQKQTLTCRF